MKILRTDTSDTVAIILDKKEGQAMVEIVAAALKTLNKRSNAYKIAKTIDDDLPVF